MVVIVSMPARTRPSLNDPLCLLLLEVYSRLSEGEFQLLRQTLLMFTQDIHTRVSFLLMESSLKLCLF